MDTNRNSIKGWSRQRALALMIVCLFAGVAGGWVIRATSQRASNDTTKIAVPPAGAASAVAPATQGPSPDQLKIMADNQAAPLIAKLNTDPKNADLQTGIGNVYYDAKQYPVAVEYYGRVLATRPSDVAVRTDMATAYWYLGDADRAIAEFDKALKYGSSNPNALFNRGLVKWEGKHDSAGAISDWKRLLAANPNYALKDQVEKMLSDVEKQSAATHAKS